MVNKRNGKIALALSGGGITGWLYEIGSLTALDDFLEEGFSVRDFDIHIGVSAGATASALIANNVSPEELFFANLGQKESSYYFERKDIFGLAVGEIFRSFGRLAKSIIPIIRYYIKTKEDIYFIDLLDHLQECQPSGFYTLEPFEKYLTRLIKENGLSDSFTRLKKELYIPATDLDTGRYTVFGDGDNKDVPIPKAIIASSAVPIVFCPVTVKGRDYIDGGVGRIPLFDVAIDKGARFTILINPVVHLNNDREKVCIPTIGGRCARIKEKGFATIADQAMKINTESRFFLALKRYQYQYPDISFCTISPKTTEAMIFMQSFLGIKDRVKIIRFGYTSTTETLIEDYDRLKECFLKHGVSVSKERLLKRMEERRKQMAAIVPNNNNH